MSLELKPGSKPFRCKPYNLNFEKRKELERQVQLLLEAGFIKRSSSNFAYPCILVPKKIVNEQVQEWRVCVDYRRLNAITIDDHWPIPNISYFHHKFAGIKYFSAFDLRHGYHHVRVHPKDRHKTAFITHNGLYEQIVMSYGFKNAPGTFQRAIQWVLRDLPFVLV